MQFKDEIVDKLLCTGCLCIGRSLIEICDQKMQQFYLEALGGTPLANSNLECPKLCLECSVRLKKAVSFRDQVKDSHLIMQMYTSLNIQKHLSDIARPHRLQKHTIKPISITPIDYLTCDVDTHENQVFVKEEVKEELDADYLTCDVDTHENQVFVKEEVKEEWDEDIQSPTNVVSYDDDNLDDLSILEETTSLEIQITRTEIENPNKPIEKKKNKLCKVNKRKYDKKSVSLAEKVRKRLKNENKRKKHVKSDPDDPKILTVELSYEEMLIEREVESKKDSYIQSKFKCETCIMGFSYKETHEAHFASKHSQEIGNYVCPICQTIMASNDSLNSHYKRHMKRYECAICSRRTMDRQVMQQHYHSAHKITLNKDKCTCNICGKVSDSLDKHRYHKDSHKARIQCPKCDKTFSHRAGLTNHRLAVHEYDNDFSCSLCNKKFKWKTSLRRHLDKHITEDKQYSPAAQCDLCEVSFTSQSSYQRHLRNSLRHVTHNDHKYICDHCERRFSDKTKLRNHIEEKHLHKAFRCPICSKPSKNRINLDQHIRNVHKRRPKDKMCHHCGKGFPTKAQLESHIRAHTGERPYICEICPATFSQQSNLYKHTRLVHQNIKHKRYPIKKPRVTDGNRTETTELQGGGVTTEQLLEPVVMINFAHDNNTIVHFKYC